MTLTDANSQPMQSAISGRQVVPGWHDIGGQEHRDAFEVQIDIHPGDLLRDQAMVLAEYWATPDDMTIQSLLPMRAFRGEARGWCLFVPKRGRVFLRAIDAEPSPPLLVKYELNIQPPAEPGIIHVMVHFSGAELSQGR